MTSHGYSVMNNMKGIPFINVEIFGHNIHRVFRNNDNDFIKIVLTKGNKEIEFIRWNN